MSESRRAREKERARESEVTIKRVTPPILPNPLHRSPAERDNFTKYSSGGRQYGWLRKLDRKAAGPIIGGGRRERERASERAIELFMSSRPLIPTERTVVMIEWPRNEQLLLI